MGEAIGIDVGGTNIKAARVSALGVVLAQASQPTAKSSAAVMAQIDNLIAACDHKNVAGIGIGIPSRVDFKTAAVFPGGYVDLSGPPLAGRLSRTGNRPVFTDNDGTMALVAEARVGAAKGYSDAVILTIGTGIGGAMMLGGKIVHGKASAGQLGHITVAYDGLECACGRLGCLETLSSGTALGRHIADAGLPVTTTAEELLLRTDSQARGVIERWIRPLRSGIDSLAATLDPEVVVLGGGLGKAAHKALASIPPQSDWFQYRVEPAICGSEAGVIGAALAALERQS